MKALRATLLGLACFTATATASQGDPALDYARQFEGDGYVFVPQRGLQDGDIFYRSYDRTVSDPKPYAGPLRQAVVSYTVGEATRLRIDTELRAKGFRPARTPPQAKEGEFCAPSASLLATLGDSAKAVPAQDCRHPLQCPALLSHRRFQPG